MKPLSRRRLGCAGDLAAGRRGGFVAEARVVEKERDDHDQSRDAGPGRRAQDFQRSFPCALPVDRAVRQRVDHLARAVQLEPLARRARHVVGDQGRARGHRSPRVRLPGSDGHLLRPRVAGPAHRQPGMDPARTVAHRADRGGVPVLPARRAIARQGVRADQRAVVRPVAIGVVRVIRRAALRARTAPPRRRRPHADQMAGRTHAGSGGCLRRLGRAGRVRAPAVPARGPSDVGLRRLPIP